MIRIEGHTGWPLGEAYFMDHKSNGKLKMWSLSSTLFLRLQVRIRSIVKGHVGLFGYEELEETKATRADTKVKLPLDAVRGRLHIGCMR